MAASLNVGEDINTPERAWRRLPPSPRVTVLATLLIRLGWLLGIHIHSHVVGEGGFNAFPYGGLDDGRYYYTTAEQLADGITPPYVLNWFPRVLAVFMELGIRDLLALKLISFAVSSIAVVMMASLAWHLSHGMRLPARRLTVIVTSVLGSLFPSNVFWTTNSLMRDGWILSFAFVAIWSFSGAGKKVLPRGRWLLGLAALAAATSFRPYVLPVYLAALVSSGFGFLNPMSRVRPRIAPVVLRLTALAIAFIGVCLLIAPVLTDLTSFNILAWRTQEQLSGKGSSMGLRFDGADTLTVVPQYLLSFVSNAIGPLPFQVKSDNQMLTFVEFPFFIIIVAGLFKAKYSNRLVRFCALFGLYWLLLLGLWNDVLGNAARNRIMAWPILAIAASPAIAHFLSGWIHPGDVRATGKGRRRGNRRSKRPRRDTNQEDVGDVRQDSFEDLIKPATALELANWGYTDEAGIRTELGRRDERRLAERRGRRRRVTRPEIDYWDNNGRRDGSIVDHDSTPQSSVGTNGITVGSGDGDVDPGRAGVDFPLFRHRRRRDRGTPVAETSRSKNTGRKEQ